MYKYKLVKRGYPGKPDEPKKWYASPLSEDAQTVKEMANAATENTSTAPSELESSLELFSNYAVRQLLQGHTVRLGNLGTLRISFKSEGVEDITQFNANTMIKEARILFNPSKSFRDSVINNLQFSNGGVLDDGVNYSSLLDYKKAKGLVTDDEEQGSGSQSGTGGSDDGEL